jgi:hypothetical protein
VTARGARRSTPLENDADDAEENSMSSKSNDSSGIDDSSSLEIAHQRRRRRVNSASDADETERTLMTASANVHGSDSDSDDSVAAAGDQQPPSPSPPPPPRTHLFFDPLKRRVLSQTSAFASQASMPPTPQPPPQPPTKRVRFTLPTEARGGDTATMPSYSSCSASTMTDSALDAADENAVGVDVGGFRFATNDMLDRDTPSTPALENSTMSMYLEHYGRGVFALTDVFTDVEKTPLPDYDAICDPLKGLLNDVGLVRDAVMSRNFRVNVVVRARRRQGSGGDNDERVSRRRAAT